MTEQYFNQDAKQLVDMLFENKLFVDKLTRDELTEIEKLIAYTLQSKFDSHWRAKELFDRITSSKHNPETQSPNS